MSRLPASPAPPATPTASLPRWAKLTISSLVALHVVAIFIAPLAMPPSSLLSRNVYMIFRPYLEAAYLDHGYAFFAPDPGPSHLVRYELEFDGAPKVEGVFPNLAEEQPRLFYHRHFMLSEFVNSAGPDAPFFESFVRSYAAHLLTEHNAQRVTLYLRRHELPSPEQVSAGMKLTDPRLYEERLLGTYDLVQATAPVVRTEEVPLGAPRLEPQGGGGGPREPGL